MSESSWIQATLVAARPQALSALLRYFRDLDIAEEAYQEACLRALKTWPVKGPPRDPKAWLILVGRNAALDGLRKGARNNALPPEESISDRDDVETALADRLDDSHYRDDILRLLFMCCAPILPATHQIALALRIVSGLSTKRIARAFLVSETAMEQRIVRAKARLAEAKITFESPSPVERSERLAAVATMVYLLFNEGYSSDRLESRSELCAEAIRLGRLLLRLFQTEPEIMGLLALMLVQHARAAARFDEDGEIVLLDGQDRSLWDRQMIAEGLALVDKAFRHKRPAAYQIQAAIAAVHVRAARPEDTDWWRIEALYSTLERLQPSPIVTLNRAVAVGKTRGPDAALTMIGPLETRLSNYFNYFGAKGALLMQLGRMRDAREAFARAIALAATPAEASYIRRRLDQMAMDPAD